jgi:hypothetical protein
MRSHDHHPILVAESTLVQRFTERATVPGNINVVAADYCADCGRFGPTVQFLARGLVPPSTTVQVEGWLAGDQGLAAGRRTES